MNEHLRVQPKDIYQRPIPLSEMLPILVPVAWVGNKFYACARTYVSSVEEVEESIIPFLPDSDKWIAGVTANVTTDEYGSVVTRVNDSEANVWRQIEEPISLIMKKVIRGAHNV